MSSGIPTKPINPRITSEGIIFGATAIRAMDIDLNTIKKSIKRLKLLKIN